MPMGTMVVWFMNYTDGVVIKGLQQVPLEWDMHGDVLMDGLW